MYQRYKDNYPLIYIYVSTLSKLSIFNNNMSIKMAALWSCAVIRVGEDSCPGYWLICFPWFDHWQKPLCMPLSVARLPPSTPPSTPSSLCRPTHPSHLLFINPSLVFRNPLKLDPSIHLPSIYSSIHPWSRHLNNHPSSLYPIQLKGAALAWNINIYDHRSGFKTQQRKQQSSMKG